MAVDYYFSTENGRTRVRLVQSAFGASEGWDDLFEGTETGWRYFLENLRIYVERLRGRTRRMINERIKAETPRLGFWRHLLSDAGGLIVGGASTVKTGDSVKVKLDSAKAVPAVIELAIEAKGLALRVPEYSDALLFVEMEGRKDTFHVGYWLSVYDDARAKALEAPAKAAFRKIHESLPK